MAEHKLIDIDLLERYDGKIKELINSETGNTTYELSAGIGADANKIVLTDSDGNKDKVTVPYASNAGTVNSHTVATDVPANAVFTDTTYSDATTSASGLMSASDKSKMDRLGTASTKDVATSGNASSTQVVMGNDTRLTDSRPASDVSSWAKASSKPSYTASEVGLGNVTNDKQVKGLSSGTTEGHVVLFGTNGYSIKDSGYTIGKSVPSNAVFTDHTYTFASGTNGFTVTPSGGSAQAVTVTPSITNNVTGSGTSGYIAKFNGGNTITNGPAIGTDTTKYLRNDGTWVKPPNDNTWTAMVGATSAANGSVGYVNAVPPKNGYNTKYLRADGTWAVPPDTVYSEGLGITINGTIINNDGVRSIAEGTTIGTVSVNTGGTTADVAVKGLKGGAFKAVDTEVTQGSANLIPSGAVYGFAKDVLKVGKYWDDYINGNSSKNIIIENYTNPLYIAFTFYDNPWAYTSMWIICKHFNGTLVARDVLSCTGITVTDQQVGKVIFNNTTDYPCNIIVYKLNE